MHLRQRQQELMDDPNLDRAEHEHALQGLARLNKYSDAVRLQWQEIKRISQERQLRPCRVLDVACGSADVLLSLLGNAGAENVRLQVTGCDISSVATSAAERRCKSQGYENADFLTLDVLKDPLPSNYDIVINSLFMHHLSESETVLLLSKMGESARHAVVINDLERSRLNLALVWTACHLLTTSYVVRFDGPASVRSAYSLAEFKALAVQAGLKGAQFRRQFPCRFFMTWRTGQ